ncbi:hypothetical protein ACMT1E_13530 [Sphingomonas flavalba]|uniref:hypothetical protein n=1 Tax=Sphingomonas flavalba TaxID=2559804 RepID=UPI0039E06EFC
MEVLAIIVLLCAFIWWQVSSKKKRALAKRNNMEMMLGASREFVPTFVETFCENEYGLGVDTENNRLAVVAGKNRRIFNFEQIIDVETLVNGRSVSRGGGVKNWGATTDTVLGGIVASGNVAGSVAALVAAHNSKIQCLSLRILTDELAEPWVEMKVFDVKERKPVSDPGVQKAMRQCEDWDGRLRALLVASRKTKVTPESAANASFA